MISIIDNTHQILFNNEKAHNELLKTINATVNHEIRNPLNSIISINLLKEKLFAQIFALMNDR